MATSEKKVLANQINGKKSRGPKNTSLTRFNAQKHGLLAVGISELDDVDSYQAILENLRKEKAPVGIIENFLVEGNALETVRLQRARRLEADYINSELNPPKIKPGRMDFSALSGPKVVRPGIPAVIGFEGAQRLVSAYQRYESGFVNRILRFLHELERLQRIRNGERLPAPAVVDVSVHAPTPSFSETLESANAVAIETPGGLDQSQSPAALLEDEESDSEASENDSSTDCETNPKDHLFST